MVEREREQLCQVLGADREQLDCVGVELPRNELRERNAEAELPTLALIAISQAPAALNRRSLERSSMAARAFVLSRLLPPRNQSSVCVSRRSLTARTR
jgi:hypothetical protein